MQVQGVNSSSNQPNFCAVYKSDGAIYTEAQKRVFKAITNKFHETSSRFNGKTAEDFYKSKKKLDFVLEPQGNDIVSVNAYVNFRERGVGVDKFHIYDSKFVVGRYNENNPFQISDVDQQLKVHNTNQTAGVISMLLLGMIPLTMIPWYTHQNRVEKETKPVIETVDTVAKKAEAKVPTLDTIMKVLKKVKK